MELATLPHYLRTEKIKSLEYLSVAAKQNPGGTLLACSEIMKSHLISDPVDGLMTTENSLDFSKCVHVYTFILRSHSKTLSEQPFYSWPQRTAKSSNMVDPPCLFSISGNPYPEINVATMHEQSSTQTTKSCSTILKQN